MNRDQLRVALEQAGVPPRWYTIGGDRNESTCLVGDGAVWTVFYSEKGQRSDERSFPSEDLACRYVYAQMIRDTEQHRRGR